MSPLYPCVQAKGPGKRGHIVADTLLPMMFLGLRKLGNICCGHKRFLLMGKRGNICVGNNVSLFARALTGTHTDTSKFLAKPCTMKCTLYIKKTSKIASNKRRKGSKDLFYLYIFAVLPSSAGMAISGAVVG